MQTQTLIDATPRKHRIQMTEKEIATYELLTHRINPDAWFVRRHTNERAIEKQIPIDVLPIVLTQGNVIEARPDGRVVMRHEMGSNAYCVVANWRTKQVITTWRNDTRDNHKTLDLTLYTWKGF
jgi:hypothetical protein